MGSGVTHVQDILIVEDGTQERDRLASIFTEAGYSVQAVASVADAESLLSGEQFRLAILDIGLSDKSGSYLFSTLRKDDRVEFIIIFTGNPSVHLKQRFLSEGAVDYIVKGSQQAQNDAIVARIKDLLGNAGANMDTTGIALVDFVSKYVSEKSRSLFYDMDDTFPPCGSCGSRDYIVTFGHKAQMPPEVVGQVICSSCGAIMDPEIDNE